jgi:hypothetical protein
LVPIDVGVGLERDYVLRCRTLLALDDIELHLSSLSTCQEPLTFIAFLTDPEPITRILTHIGEPTSPPLLHPARGPPQTELAMGPDGGKQHEVAQGFFPDDLDQSPEFDPTDPEPIPQDDFDQSWGA